MQSRVSLFKVPGGDTIQMLKTKEYLEKLGIKVDISTELEPDLKEYDLVHLFNIIRPQEVYLQANNAKKQGKQVILSPIYVSYIEYLRNDSVVFIKILSNLLKPSQIEYLKIIARAIINKEFHRGTQSLIIKGYRRLQKKILNLTDIMLPNSQSEINRLRKDIGINIPDNRIIKVPNAIDREIFNYNNIFNFKIPDNLMKYKNCILCVARIEGRKNQLNLVKAVNNLPNKVVLIGKPAPNHIKYYKKIKQEAGDNVIFIGEIKHEDLPLYYFLAKVHVLPSWFETTGLSSLEAAAMGCNIVITKKGDTEEYFKDYAFYCEPDNIYSIRDAIINAYNTSLNENFREYVLQNYTWEKTAQKTLKAYEKLLNNYSSML